MTLEIRDVWPNRATYRPGEAAYLHVTLFQPSTEAHRETVEIQVRLTWLHSLVAEQVHPVALAAGAEMTIQLPLPLPPTPFRGYGVMVTSRDDTGQVAAQRSTAVDVLAHWSQAPRYGFFSDFAPNDTTPQTHVAALARYHITVAQFYDWMWRHYALMPPTEEFTDALGREVSLRTVRAKVAACQQYGIAALGYAAVYGAEPEYADAHPEEVVYDAEGKPYSLADLFYIMNLAATGPWRRRMLATMRDAVRDVPFDGLHLDQYGFPKTSAFDSSGQPYAVAADFATFIDDARNAIQQPGRDAGVIFNAVENWPIEAVAATTQDAVYIEVWPPYVDYRDLQVLIVNAQRLAPSKQVILAAYMKPLGAIQAGEPATAEAAEAATRLASAAIWANGGFHLLLGEQDAALHDPYYVTHTVLRPAFARVMHAYYDFVVRYLNVLSDQQLRLYERETPSSSEISSSYIGDIDIEVEGWRTSADADAGAIWTIERVMPGYLTISLINLTHADSTAWNAPTLPATALTHLVTHVRLKQASAVRQIFAATPDDGQGAMVALPYTLTPVEGTLWTISFELPLLHYWTLIVVEIEHGEDQADPAEKGCVPHVGAIA